MQTDHDETTFADVTDRDLVQKLANEYDRSDTEVARILHEEVQRLADVARISTYVGVIAARRTRNRLRDDASRAQ
jgi:hypothetical protein